MRGRYVFRQAGKIVGEQTNLITDSGRREILRFLAGQRGALGGAIGIGAGSIAPALTNTELVLEYGRTMVEVTAPDFNRRVVVYKTTLPQLLEGNIYEVGVWSNATNIVPVSNVLSFDPNNEAWTGGTWDATGTRLGGQGLRVDAATNTTTTVSLPIFAGDLTAVGYNDTFALAFYVWESNADLVRITFRSADALRYFTYTVDTPVKGYNIVKFTKANIVATGAIGYDEIVSVDVTVVSNPTDAPLDPELGTTLGYTGTRVSFDRLLVKPYNAEDIGNILISRSVLATPITKAPVAPMEIEYYLELGV